MRRFSKKVPLTLLAFVLAFAVMAAVVAAWPQYQGNGYHNGQITGTAPPISSPSIQRSKNLGNGIATESVMLTEGSTTYAYTLTSGGWLCKTNLLNPGGSGDWAYQFPDSSGYQLGSPCVINDGNPDFDGIYVAANDYNPLLLNNTQFTDTPLGTGWSSGGTGTVTYPTVSPDPNTPSDPNSSTTVCQLTPGASISQSFTFTGTSGSYETQLYSLIRQMPQGLAGQQVTFTVTGPGISHVDTALQNGNWTNIQHYDSVTLTQNATYTVTAEASASNSANVQLNHLEFNWRRTGVYKVPFGGGSSTLIASINNGQACTPISVYNVSGTYYLYYGILSASGNNYFQVKLDANATPLPSVVTPYASGNRHYWAGATLVDIPDAGKHVVFGSDNGYIYVRPVSSFGTSGTGSTINLANFVANPDNVRCTISQDGTYIYFTSQGGYLWRISIASLLTTPAVTFVPLPDRSTSTPAISQNEYVYVGHYGGPGGSGGVVAVPVSNFAQSALITVYSGDAVQASPIVYTNGDVDYIYFTTNVSTGRGYCYSFDTSAGPPSYVWDAGGSYYALQGFSAKNGYIVYGDDNSTLHIFHQ